MANVIRFLTTVIGKAPVRDGNVTDVTLQYSGANHPNGFQTMTMRVDNAIAATFSLNQVVGVYLAPAGADRTAVEGAATTTKGSTKD